MSRHRRNNPVSSASSNSPLPTPKDDGRVNSPCFPSIRERLNQLRPSRELLEFYRCKIAEYDEEHESIVKKLETYKDTYQDQHRLLTELRRREDDILELQRALSDMQHHLFQEREHILRLYAENDRLKIQELDDKKKIHQLLALGDDGRGEITYFLKEPPACAIIPQRTTKKEEKAGGDAKPKITKAVNATQNKKTDAESEKQMVNHIETLSLQVQSLQAQLEDHTKLAKEESESLRDEKRLKEEEFSARCQRDAKTIAVLTEKLQKTQDLLYDSTKDFLDLRYKGRADERHWMDEKDEFLRRLDECREKLDAEHPEGHADTSFRVLDDQRKCRHHVDEIQALENKVEEGHKLGEMYREQVIHLEDQLSLIKEEGDVTREIFQDRSSRMTNRLHLMNSRYQDLEKRRNLEVAGFKTDIKNLRTRLKDLERQLYKVTMGVGDYGPEADVTKDVDMHILRQIHNTANRSKKIVGEVKDLKAKVYSIENDLRHL